MTKDPSEIITVTFDFSGTATSCTNPSVAISVVAGREDSNASSMLSGTPQVDGTSILQRVIGGLNGNTYKLRCEIDDADGEHWVVADTLTVQSA